MTPSFTTGSQDFIIDGSGTLILPSGSFNNAVRMVNNAIRVDSSGSETFTIKTTTETTSYQWMIPGQVGPIMTISYTEGQSESIVLGGDPTITEIPLTKSVIYNPAPEAEITATHEFGQLSGVTFESAFPNPTSGLITVDIMAEKNQSMNLKVSNLIGQVLIIENIMLNVGGSQHQIDLSTLPEGAYLLSLSNEKGMATQKIVKTN